MFALQSPRFFQLTRAIIFPLHEFRFGNRKVFYGNLRNVLTKNGRTATGNLINLLIY